MSDLSYENEHKIDKQQKGEDCTLGIAAFVFGVLSIASNFVLLPMGFYFPFVGVIFAVCDRVRSKGFTKFGKAGLICSIVGYAISVIIAIMLALLIVIYIIIFIAINVLIALIDAGVLAQ